MRSSRLQGRRIVITGAASGMGLAIAKLFAAEGAAIALLDVSDGPLHQAASLTGAHCQTVNVSSPEEVQGAIDAAAVALGGIDGIVNAAGIYSKSMLADLPLASWHQTLAVNLTGPFLVCRFALPHLRAAGKATIVNIGSIGSLQPTPGQCAYAASKGGLSSLTKALAAELGPENIRANLIAPGMVHSGMTSTRFTVEQADAFAASLSAIPRAGQPEEIATAALYLTSDDSSYVNGSTITIDGGRTYH